MKTTKTNLIFACFMMTLFIFAGCGGAETNQTAQVSQTPGLNPAPDSLKDCSTDPCGACDNSERYPATVDGGGIEITPSQAREQVSAFSAAHSSIIKGAFLSKVALDSIFCYHRDYNGIYCYIAEDATGKQMMIIQGWRDDAHDQNRVNVTFNNTIPEEDRYKVFMTEVMCPTMCSSLGY